MLGPGVSVMPRQIRAKASSWVGSGMAARKVDARMAREQG